MQAKIASSSVLACLFWDLHAQFLFEYADFENEGVAQKAAVDGVDSTVNSLVARIRQCPGPGVGPIRED